MKLVKGDIWNSDCQLLVITSNGVINKANELVMGAGIAKQAKEKFPIFPRLAGLDIIHSRGKLLYDELYYKVYLYGFIPVILGQRTKIYGIFQTKDYWEQRSKLSLIGYSVQTLNLYIQETGVERISLNFPGIGLGGLSKEQVLPIISDLSDKVTIYEK